MIEGGAIEEVEKLKSLNLDRSLPIMRAHGVPEILNYLDKPRSFKACAAILYSSLRCLSHTS